MSPEWLTAIGTLGTFLVIAASAGAALFQLRHMRSSNQIVALNEVRETIESAQFQAALRFVSDDFQRLMQDPNARKNMVGGRDSPLALEFEQARLVANFFESTGEFIKRGIIDREIACDLWSGVVLRNWGYLEPFVTNLRIARDNPGLFTSFEFWASISRDWREKHAQGTFPPGVERMPHSEPWPEVVEKLR